MFVEINKTNGWSRTRNVEPDQLWTGIREGDKEALSKLFCMYYNYLFNYGYNIAPRHDLVKDSIQELFLTLWKRRSHIKEAYSVKSYLFYSLRRILLRNITKQKNRSDRNEIYVDNFFEEAYNVEELMIHFETEQDQKEKLKEAIESLSKRQKEAIFLKFYEGLSNTEIARVMDINQQSVYNHVSKAIGNLQQFVQV